MAEPSLDDRIKAGSRIRGYVEIHNALIADLQAIAAQPDAVPRGANALWLFSYYADQIVAAALREAEKEIERLKDAWMEITAKAVPYQTADDDPERIISYVVPCGPLHRAAGKLGYQMFNGQEHLSAAIEDALKAKKDLLAERANRQLWETTWGAWKERAEQAEATLAAKDEEIARLNEDCEFQKDIARITAATAARQQERAEMAEAALAEMRPVVEAARQLVERQHEIHETEQPPTKWRVDYGELVKMMEALAALDHASKERKPGEDER